MLQDPEVTGCAWLSAKHYSGRAISSMMMITLSKKHMPLGIKLFQTRCFNCIPDINILIILVAKFFSHHWGETFFISCTYIFTMDPDSVTSLMQQNYLKKHLQESVVWDKLAIASLGTQLLDRSNLQNFSTHTLVVPLAPSSHHAEHGWDPLNSCNHWI